MTTLPVQPKICARCKFYVPAYVERQGLGFCTWREEKNSPAQPHMNYGSVYELSPDNKVLSVRWDSGCGQFQAKEKK